MSDAPDTTLLSQIVAIVLAVFGGGAVTRGWDRWRRNGRGNGDADRIVRAIKESGEQVSEEIKTLSTATTQMHFRIERVLGKVEANK